MTVDRIAHIGDLVAPLIRDDLSWVERRKESVEILDDTALRRQISVDFSLRGHTVPLLEKRTDQSDALYCAPIYVLPKAPANLMSFDLEDEGGTALTLINRTDNGRISGAALKAMAAQALQDANKGMPDGLAFELQRLAEADAMAGQEICRRLLNPQLTGWPDEVAVLKEAPRLEWWLRTMAHSSLVVVLFRAASPRRKLVKLTFEQPIATNQRRLTRLGWTPYKVGIDAPLIEARSYHFEAESPPGLRISDAVLSNDAQDPVAESGFLRRVHLYLPEAQSSGAGTGILWLSVSGAGFVGGAFVAAALAVFVLFACWIGASNIAANATSAPALLLALPALIASYVARPDQHALTTRLLSGARRLLLSVAGLAYGAAALVTLSGNGPSAPDAVANRTDVLERWLGVLAFSSLIPFVGLSITFMMARRQWLKQLTFKSTCHNSCFVAAAPQRLFNTLSSSPRDAGVPSSYELVEHARESQVLFVRSRWHGDWLVSFRIEESDGDSLLMCSSEHVSRIRGIPLGRLLVRRQETEIVSVLNAVQDWATTKDETDAPR